MLAGALGLASATCEGLRRIGLGKGPILPLSLGDGGQVRSQMDTPHYAYNHQRHVFEASRDLEGYALWHEMGCGKTAPTIWTAAHLFLKGEIDGLLVLAPNGVHSNWTLEEIPTHMPENVRKQTLSFAWYSSKAAQAGFQAELKQLFAHKGLAVLVASYDAIMTERGAVAIKKFLQSRRCLYVLDESGRVKTPGSKRTKRVSASATYAPYRRVLTGTPVDNNPMDLYTQIRFIRPDVWRQHGIKDFNDYKNTFGIWEMRQAGGQGRQFPALVRYRNLPLLAKIVAEVGDRRLKADVLDLPDKIYMRREFGMDPKQKAAYKKLEKDFIAWLGDGSSVTADLALTRMLRMQQLTSGFVGNDDGVLVPVGENVRLQCLKETLEDVNGSVIIWARFSADVDAIRRLLGDDEAVYYDGRTSDDDRVSALQRFQKDGTARFFVAKASAAGEGLTLHRAKTVIYYSNTFSLRERLQSEDRAHRAGMTKEPVTYIDILASNSIDGYVLSALRKKRDLASCVTGDQLPAWA